MGYLCHSHIYLVQFKLKMSIDIFFLCFDLQIEGFPNVTYFIFVSCLIFTIYVVRDTFRNMWRVVVHY